MENSFRMHDNNSLLAQNHLALLSPKFHKVIACNTDQ